MTLLRAYELLLRPLMIRLSPLLIDLGTFDNFLFGIDDLIISGYSHHIDPRSVIRIQRQTSSGVVTGWKRSFFVLYFFFSDLSYGSTRQEFQWWNRQHNLNILETTPAQECNEELLCRWIRSKDKAARAPKVKTFAISVFFKIQLLSSECKELREPNSDQNCNNLYWKLGLNFKSFLARFTRKCDIGAFWV